MRRGGPRGWNWAARPRYAEQVRGYGWENTIDTWFSDLRYAARRLRANPGFTAVSILTLALGIGASTAIFSVIEGVLLKPLPYPHSGRLVALLHTAPGINIPVLNLAASLYLRLQRREPRISARRYVDGDSWTVTGLAGRRRFRGCR